MLSLCKIETELIVKTKTENFIKIMSESIAEPKAKVVVLTPRADFYQDGDLPTTVEVELPGVKKDGVNLSLENGRLTVTARREEREDGNAIYR